MNRLSSEMASLICISVSWSVSQWVTTYNKGQWPQLTCKAKAMMKKLVNSKQTYLLHVHMLPVAYFTPVYFSTYKAFQFKKFIKTSSRTYFLSFRLEIICIFTSNQVKLLKHPHTICLYFNPNWTLLYKHVQTFLKLATSAVVVH